MLALACGSTAAPPPSPPPSAAPSDAGGASSVPCVRSGCSGTVCVEQGDEVMTTCEYRPEYDCYQQAACERQPTGACGWTETEQLEACIEQARAQPVNGG